MNGTRRWGVLGAVGALGAGALIAASAAWACIAGPTLNLNPATVKAGGDVALSGFSYNGDLPIVVRFNALDGPILGTFQPAEGRFGDPESLVGKVTIPATTKPGNYVLVALQYASDGSLAQVPVRALVTVTSAAGGSPVIGASPFPTEQGRSVGLTEHKSSANAAALILVGGGTALIVGLLAWVFAVGPVRRQPKPEAARVPVSR